MILKEYLVALKDVLYPRTFGQLGEDAVIANHLGWLGLPVHENGVYLDIGAYHPTRGSNSYRFYKQGSRGYAIDVGKRKQRIWSLFRPRDTFINAAVVPNSSLQEYANFYMANAYGEVCDHISGSGIHNRVEPHRNWAKVKTISAKALGELIDKDKSWFEAPWRFISIDIEGLDEDFISDLDLIKLAPDIIAVEHFPPKHISAWEKIPYLANSCELNKKLEGRGFILQSVCGPTLIFVRAASQTAARSDKEDSFDRT